MKIKIAVAALSFALVSGSAIAQPRWVDRYDEGLSTRQLMSIVRSAGLRPVTQVARSGHYYVVHAVDGYGDTKRVIIDADFGDIVRIAAVPQRRVVRDHRFGPRFRWFEDDVAVMRPPASIRRGRRSYDHAPQARLPDEDRPTRTVPPQRSRRTAAVDPGQRVQPPVPRSRPSVPSEPAASTAAPGEASKPERTTTPETTASTSPAAPAPAKPARRQSEPAARTASPRVVLPGGPTPKAERDAANRGVDAAGTDETNKKAPSETSKLPPMQGLE